MTVIKKPVNWFCFINQLAGFVMIAIWIAIWILNANKLRLSCAEITKKIKKLSYYVPFV